MARYGKKLRLDGSVPGLRYSYFRPGAYWVMAPVQSAPAPSVYDPHPGRTVDPTPNYRPYEAHHDFRPTPRLGGPSGVIPSPLPEFPTHDPLHPDPLGEPDVSEPDPDDEIHQEIIRELETPRYEVATQEMFDVVMGHMGAVDDGMAFADNESLPDITPEPALPDSIDELSTGLEALLASPPDEPEDPLWDDPMRQLDDMLMQYMNPGGMMGPMGPAGPMM